MTYSILEDLSYLALQFEDSQTELLEKICKKSLPVSERNRKTNDSPESHYADAVVKTVVQRTKRVAAVLDISPVQAALLTGAMGKIVGKDSFGWSDIASFFDVPPMALTSLKADFDELVERNYLQPEPKSRHNAFNAKYIINPALFNALLQSQPFSAELLAKPSFDRYRFCTEVSDLIELRRTGTITTQRLFEMVKDLEKKHGRMDFVNAVAKAEPDIEGRTFFCTTCFNQLSFVCQHTGIKTTLCHIYEHIGKRVALFNDFVNNRHPLLKTNLVELVYDGGTHLVLSQKGKKVFFEDDGERLEFTQKNNNVIVPDKITEKRLFFGNDLQSQLLLFQDNLMESNFAQLQRRLEENSLPKGVAALFYGLPGTGKTEAAMQIAKATGRTVVHVDIAESKSMWYGESEKKIKGIFADYQRLCLSEKRKPILLFNEADALFSKRRDIISLNTDQTENAIQNILLEEMEKLDGILIATTNLVNNFDSAFERRFLFKIKFDQPTAEAKKGIWKERLPWLSDDDCALLAAKYNFSGGEIENIVRKSTMQELLYGQHPDIEEINELCGHEKLNGSRHNRMGFRTQNC